MEHKSFTCDACGLTAGADDAKDWRKLTRARITLHFCTDTCNAAGLLRQPRQGQFLIDATAAEAIEG